MTNFPAGELKKAMKDILGLDPAKMTPDQLWCIVKLLKHCRGRCRTNAALNNYLNTAFSPAKFREVEKTNADGTTYKGLQIIAANGAVHDGDNSGAI